MDERRIVLSAFTIKELDFLVNLWAVQKYKRFGRVLLERISFDEGDKWVSKPVYLQQLIMTKGSDDADNS